MATTTNYGWTTPDDTDLVKDGAAAIRTLGSAVDTSFVDLLGGTTGQILTTASNTDLDFSFVTPTLPVAGLNLISPTSIAFSGTSASSSAGKTIFSACTSLSINGVFSSTYNNYLILTTEFTQSTSIMNFLRFRASGTDTTSGYNNAGWFQNSGGAWNTNPDVTDACYHAQPGTGQGSAIMNIQNPNLAINTFMNCQRAVVGQGSGHVSSQSGNTQFDGFTIYQASGNFTGTIRVYGFQN